MYEHLPPDLPRLRTLETWLTLTLDQVRQKIAKVQEVEAEQAARRLPPEPPAWIITTSRAPSARGTKPPRTVHVGDCGMTEGGTTQAISRDQALRALTEGVPGCQFCRPDTELGVLE
ncbi:DUF6233 domain-containing protein [Streptomyces violascens]|uniref:Uncharacterized protein n=1 Tax=Streptomyces violascens TaxID=67381 RepID=A0ABQ3QXD0_9ACTN|nr:DUF6233 domain-containing protein [Streptomyces violascens]GHI41934.1 hypothetical protein Sviol_63420 [Streptomyces violascens]